MNPKAFIFIGRSGSGKGTQSKLLKKFLQESDTSDKDVLYIYTGQEFRKFVKGSSSTQILSNKINDDGGLQPEFLAVYMWVKILVDQYKEGDDVIFDGTPRKRHEAEVLDSVFSFYNMDKPYVLHMDIDEKESSERLIKRGREDDNSDDIKERQEWYETDVENTLDYYSENPKYNFIKINASESIEEVHKEILEKINL